MTDSNNQRRAPKHVLERPKVRKVVEALILDGKTDYAIAKQVGVTPSAVTRFRARHSTELQQAASEVERQITDYAIAQKVNRIAGLQALADQVQAVIDDRGLIERQITTTEHAEIVRERFARELPAEMRAIYHAAAEELAQLPRPDVHVQNNVVLIREREVIAGRLEPLG